ncbi:AraC family transcriptional regulator [Phenylobacterium sp.]|uniref:AraC family transcriptional regulator n=1 Tax=Phenylobacterium sp. TaxID=1871053 RepID=UPI002CD9E192|nr:AraC family transcriptional regulator [Phenylobacterium sp.]HLZ75327.1 AraC family transcriptional regulator [Phenylobacterium sp.]
MNAAPQPSTLTDPMERARRHIEANLDGALSLGDLADAARLSPYHFTRLFTGRYGLSPMAYVRVRRLEGAAERLRAESLGGARLTIIDLAFDCGFDSQEGFTRAFIREFGISPGRYRDGERPHRPETLAMPTADLHASNLTQAPSPARKPALRIAGIGADFDEANVSGIPLLWGQFAPRLPLPGQVGGGTFGVCCAGPGGKGVHYIAGAALAEGAPAPPGMKVIEIPPHAYLVFRQVLSGGPLHPQMQSAVREIWGERVPASGHTLARGVPDLEVYPDDFAPDRAGGWVEWWIPVEA